MRTVRRAAIALSDRTFTAWHDIYWIVHWCSWSGALQQCTGRWANSRFMSTQRTLRLQNTQALTAGQRSLVSYDVTVQKPNDDELRNAEAQNGAKVPQAGRFHFNCNRKRDAVSCEFITRILVILCSSANNGWFRSSDVSQRINIGGSRRAKAIGG